MDGFNAGTLLRAGISHTGKSSLAERFSLLKELLLPYRRRLSLMLQAPEVESMPVSTVNNRSSEAVENVVQCIKDTVNKRYKGQNLALDVIADSVLRSMDAPSNLQSKPSGVYLVLGLSPYGKRKLVEDVAEHLSVEGVTPVIHVDLSDGLNSQSLLFSVPPMSGQAVSVIEAVEMWPYCVVVLVLDKIENADASVYSNLLRILDTGFFSYGGGSTVDFRSTTIILISDQGNKEIISKAFCPYQDVGHSGKTTHQDVSHGADAFQQGTSRFRSELLHRVDDVMLFNTISQGRRDFTTLSKRVGWPILKAVGRGAVAKALFMRSERYEELMKSMPSYRYRRSASVGAPADA